MAGPTPRHSRGILPRPGPRRRDGGDFTPDGDPGDDAGRDQGSSVQRSPLVRSSPPMPDAAGPSSARSASGEPQRHSLTTKAEVHKYWAGKLHGSYDGAALRDTRHVPAAQSCISDGTRHLPGRHYVNVIKLRVNTLPTISRTKRRRPDDVSSSVGCRASETLGHVLQACHKGHRGRVKRHNTTARYVAMHLNQLKWSVIWEPHYNVHGKVMKTDLVASKGAMAVIIDLLVVGPGMELAFLHEQKAAKYTFPDLLQQVH
ncbi:unnamed protein product [Ixodes pacificus]